MTAPVWIVGVGNVFLGDDGFGCAVIDAMRGEALPPGVHVEDYGIRATHLAYALLDPPALLLIADATAQGGAPGTVYLMEPDLEGTSDVVANAHAMNLGIVFQTARSLGARLPTTWIIGCEPASVGEQMGLSEPVAASIDAAKRVILDLVRSELRAPAAGASP